MEGAKHEDASLFSASGYVRYSHSFFKLKFDSLAIVYGACAVSNWISPLIVSWVKPKFAMFIGSLTYV